ncbi:MAG: type II toxin-antitoxin system VapC family toxin [Actinomycetota bacterium]|nr:type II toxin-antitoxin system VapC family toxin [Actinomycetota bacterium]
MPAGLVDTSVIIDWDDPTLVSALPDEIAVSTITLAELAAGPHLTDNSGERARRQARLQQAEALFEPLEFDRAAARSFGQVVAAVTAAGRSHRPRFADLLIASVAHANGLDLYTRNAKDLAGLEDLVVVRPL